MLSGKRGKLPSGHSSSNRKLNAVSSCIPASSPAPACPVSKCHFSVAFLSMAEHSRKRGRTAAHAEEELAVAQARPEEVAPQFRVPGLVVVEHTFKAPLDYSDLSKGEIDIFVRELFAPSMASKHMNYLLYLNGGPGFEGPRVCESNGWVKTASSNFRVVLMDQRGTGRSSPITVRNLAKQGSSEAQAEYLTHFRADSIVRDAELVRLQLVPEDKSTGGRWSILGQSFGGFCCFTYLSLAPAGLLEVMITGGIPPGIDMPCSAELVYSALYRRVLEANVRYYTRFPDDVQQVQRIVAYLSKQPGGALQLPNGNLLTPRLLQTLGLAGLGSGGGFERLHYLLDSFFDSEGEVNPAFIKAFDQWHSWDANPLYALLHESIYCQGGVPSAWAAHRIRHEPEFHEVFDALASVAADRPVMFTGEMVYPWMFDDIASLRPYKVAANLIANKVDWTPLYNRDALARAQVPVASATYVEDMYVDYNLAQVSAGYVNRMRQWHTSEYKHSGIRDDGCRVLERLLGMLRNIILLE